MQRVEVCWQAFQLLWQILQCLAMTLLEQILLVEQVMDLVEFVEHRPGLVWHKRLRQRCCRQSRCQLDPQHYVLKRLEEGWHQF